jgi:hypothetical protein
MSTGDDYSKLHDLVRTKVLERIITIDTAIDVAITRQINETIDVALGIDRSWGRDIRLRDCAVKDVLVSLAKKILDTEENKRRIESIIQAAVDKITNRQLALLVKESDYKIKNDIQKAIDESIARALEGRRESLDLTIATHVNDIMNEKSAAISKRWQ